MSDKSCKIDDQRLIEAINRLADAVESLRLDMHSYFSEELPTRRGYNGNHI